VTSALAPALWLLAVDRSTAQAVGYVVSALAGLAAGVAVLWLVWRFVLRDVIARGRDDDGDDG
jgi:hypothetical protein